MLRARMVLAVGLLVATFLAATTMPDTGAATPAGCADVATGDACPGCKGESDRALRTGATACATVCAVMTAVLPAPTRIPPAAAGDGRETQRSTPSGVPVAPERAPPRASIPA